MTALVYPCGGGSVGGRLATDVALELARRGLAEVAWTAALAAPLRGRARSERPAVAVDGCALACATRALEAGGIRPAASVRIDDPSVRPSRRRRAAIERLLRALGSSVEPVPAPIDPAVSGRPGSRRRGTGAAYLGAVASLSECRGNGGEAETPISGADLSRLFGVSRSSAGEVLARLERDGLVIRARGRRFVLTPAGRRAAERSRCYKALAERFLVEYLGYSPKEAGAHAGRLAAAMDDAMATRLGTALRKWTARERPGLVADVDQPLPPSPGSTEADGLATYT